MPSGFSNLSICKIIELYRKKELLPSQVAKICIERVNQYEPSTQAWVRFDPDQLTKRAAELDATINVTESILPLYGIPVGVKDIMNTIDFPTEMGSPIWRNFTPGNDARAVFHVKRAGGIIAGKTVTAEFAVHTLGKTLNPHDSKRSPGTSSSGSAAAIATGMIPFALGTQTAGSIVRPASFCGVYGCKPSFGLIPRTGMLKTTDSLDTVGYFVYHFEDILPVFEVLRVHGLDYPISHKALNDPKRQRKPSNRPWKIAFVRTHTWEHVPLYAKKALEEWINKLAYLKEFEICETNLPKEMEQAHEIHAKIYNRALAYYFQEEYKKKELVSPIMNSLIEEGNKITPEEYRNALNEQQKLANLMDSFLQKYDIMICHSTAGVAPLREEREKPDPALMWTMTYLPVISAPVFTSPEERLPYGVQLVARRYNDYLLFAFAKELRAGNLIPSGPNPLI